jgi:hypothetical protein
MAAHAESRQKSLTSLKQHLSNLDGWEFSHEKDGVKLYSKSVSESSIPLTRGDTLLPGHKYTPQQVASVATLPGCRSIWDEKFGGNKVEMFLKD